ncbi:hypothetical protein F0L17_20730 [Streptomyces sp. TRM43335]|uniref:DDE Tnp4 domain-containing protein n=1 Tax=Streptomyces taklimakanensis TaxID=2569853 RepID=A0A6G2BHF1_9ACTN|nr:hypothetical protein [Streptomyces taklimakanensis]MTE21493.1 hypothetical protein [Streptomyces taklimakanensis]
MQPVSGSWYWPGKRSGVGKGIHAPFRPHPDIAPSLAPDTRIHNRLPRGIRALGERTTTGIKQRWRTLQRVTLSPGRMGDITRAALVLNGTWK